jgi:tryptophan-rich sensory protein
MSISRNPPLPGPPPSALASALAFLGFLALCLLAGYLGSLATRPNIPDWYAALEKPPLTPPNVLFPVAWTILYITMAVSAWLVWRAAGSRRWSALTPFFVQLALNVAWSFAFFAARSPLAGVVVIALLIAAIGWTIRRFHGISRPSALLLVPYLAWVVFATYLNVGILFLNG